MTTTANNSSSGMPSADGNGGKVLVVDDEDYVRGILGKMLEAMGYTVVEAHDGIKGLELFEANTDLVACVVDLTMPGMAGMELLSRIQEIRSDIPVLLMSGYSRLEVRQQEARSSQVRFLQKPFTMEQFGLQFREALSAAN